MLKSLKKYQEIEMKNKKSDAMQQSSLKWIKLSLSPSYYKELVIDFAIIKLSGRKNNIKYFHRSFSLDNSLQT